MIINIGSAITCVANSALGAYGATKAGLAYWNDALRRELQSTGVRGLPGRAGPDQDRVHGRHRARWSLPAGDPTRSWTTPLPG